MNSPQSRRLAALLLCSVWILALSGCREGAAVAAPDERDEPLTVDVVLAEEEVLQHKTTQPATIEAFHESQLHSKVSGYLKTLAVDIGDEVRQDAVLAVIDVPELAKQRERQEAQVQQLKANEERAAAGVELAKAGVTAAGAARDEAAANVAAAEATLAAYRAELERVTQLVQEKSVASRLLDEAREHFQSAQASRQAVDAAIAAAEANVVVAQARQTAAEADVRVAAATTREMEKQLEETDVMIAYASLKAPFDGVVVERYVDPGDLVRNAQTTASDSRRPLITIAAIDRVRVRIAVPENDAAWIRVGDAAAVQLRAFPGQAFPGTVARLARRLDESTRTMLVEVDLDNPDRAILPGMYGQATITQDRQLASVVLPAGSVRFSETGAARVYVVGDDNKVRLVEVETGYDDGSKIEITRGLSGGERVVTAMLDRLEDGQSVRVP
ncbi:MAG: efflux RND transporter periplasmic adaptor subunit [Pirellulaceae bacterium]